ncbi:phosphoribosylformylglycinamidine cyclo-ligase [Candidatus Pantoea edessiphila]|uniref:Phosphoribosylformylglycinamidine cyclo-ligase n=1 Tax=Candidatus Pantoea edessiphila TaxID=2044610 RepID=A0A2P5SYF8_9GAMM|nr:phosphoribosylformylglycinamidine cyclo-ligase [Candidatus Pantoea edessiphila]MBK4775507.1 phosphoribosylformylglycinamidine cyclo-ligase [Pantoea sp. Edef]PPI87365.1 phosphoribosylformylglycinamidine cyclo-ligase [Candidatus Pantoea edessiphila]
MLDKKSIINYKDAGVNIDTSNLLVKYIKNISKKTNRPGIISSIGGFSALCQLPNKYVEPVIVTTTDGVGSKLLLAMDEKHYNSIGVDLVAMCVNDIVVCGAEPLFFLDYYSTSKLDVNIARPVMQGIVEGCINSGCSFIGGETAEIPGMYFNQGFDLAGFCIGVVEKSKIINGKEINDGDALIALSSSGLHANGYSLINKIIKVNQIDPAIKQINKKPLIHYLIKPTRIYVKNILKLIKIFNIKAMIHITGGGFIENIPRILPDNTQAIINESSWSWSPIFNWIQRKSNINTLEMYRTFNCGVGMLLVANPIEVEKIISFMNHIGEKAWKIGIIENSYSKERVVFKQ